MTVIWALVIGIVTLTVVMTVGFGLAALDLMAMSGGSDTPTAAELQAQLMASLEDRFALITVVQTLVMIAMVWFLTRAKDGLTRTRMLALEPIGIRRLLFWVAVTIGGVFLLSEIPMLLFDFGQETALDWLTLLQPAWLAVLLLVVLAPLSEELLFRGFIFGGLAPSVVGPIGAIVLSSAIFAVIHVQYSWLIMTQIFIYGCVFGVVRWRSGSLWPPMIAHGLINGLAAVMFFLGQSAG